MSEPERCCPGCGGQIHDGTLCQPCLDRLAHDLDTIHDALAEMDTQLARLAVRGNDGGTARSAERPLPYDLAASEVIDLVRSVLVGWTRDIVEHGGTWPDDTLPAMTALLRWHDWRRHDAADEFADELRYALGQVRACIDIPPERRYLGPCGSINVDDDGNAYECTGDVVMVGRRLPRCKDCGATYFRDDRLEWIANLAEDQLVTASIAAGALSAWGEHITPDLVRSWAHRGRLVARGHDRAGHPTYRFGEARALALATIKRRATRGEEAG